MTEDEMVGWHLRLNGHGFGWTLGRRAPAERLLWPGRAPPSASQLLAFSPGQEQAAGVRET